MKVTITAEVSGDGGSVPKRLKDAVVEALQAEIESVSFSVEKNGNGDEIDCSLSDVEVFAK